MRPVPISLIHAFTTEVAVTANLAFDPGRPVNLDIADLRCEHTTLEPDGGVQHWRVKLRLQQEATPHNNTPYSFRIEIEGWFTLQEGFPAADAARFVTVNGTSILYGLAREQLRMAMSTGPFVPILLPSVTFAPALAASRAAGPTESPTP